MNLNPAAGAGSCPPQTLQIAGCDGQPATDIAVIPASAGIQFVGLISLKNNQMYDLDSRLRGNDGFFGGRFESIHTL